MIPTHVNDDCHFCDWSYIPKRCVKCSIKIPHKEHAIHACIGRIAFDVLRDIYQEEDGSNMFIEHNSYYAYLWCQERNLSFEDDYVADQSKHDLYFKKNIVGGYQYNPTNHQYYHSPQLQNKVAYGKNYQFFVKREIEEFEQININEEADEANAYEKQTNIKRNFIISSVISGVMLVCFCIIALIITLIILL